MTVTGDPTTAPVPEQDEPEKKLYVTVPPALLVTPLSVAESVTDPPTVMTLDESVVLIVTAVAGLTVRGSHGLVDPMLFESPEYRASKPKDPALGKVWGTEFGTTPFVTETGFPTGLDAPEHVEPVKNMYWTVPPGWNPPVIVAESVTEPPAVIVFADSVVDMLVLAR